MSVSLDSRIHAELEPDETLLWQAKPHLFGLLTPFSILVMVAGLIAIPLVYDYLANVALTENDAELLVAARVVAAAIVAIIFGHTAYTIWSTPRRLYAVTNRRLLEWNGNRLRRAETPLDVEKIRVIRRLGYGAGDVIWRVQSQVRSGGDSSTSNTRRIPIGFRGVSNPKHVAHLLQGWLDERVEEARQANEAFRRAAVDGRTPELVEHGGATSIIRPDLGIAITYPRPWHAYASKSIKIGPIVGKWEPQPLAKAGSDWDNLMLRSFGGTSLEIGFIPDTSRKTLDDLRNCPWAGILNVQKLAAEADVRVGPWRGFAITSTLQGAGLFGLPLLSSDHLYREIWLDDGRRQIVLKMTSSTRDQQAQLAVDAVIGTLRRT
jgi:hypothetical protein